MYSNESKKFIFALIFLIIAPLTFTPALATQSITEQNSLPEEISELLSDYSQNLENLTDQSVFRSTNYSSEMKMLIIDRQYYYKEFLKKGYILIWLVWNRDF